MGMSLAKDELYYVYVLRLEGNVWYVGSTKSFERRMRSHFGRGGSLATKEKRVVAIHEVLELRDYQIRTDCAHERAEVLIAIRYAERYGAHAVRGAKHGKGWSDQPSAGNLRDIGRYRKFAATPDGVKLTEALRPVDPLTLLPASLSGALRPLRALDCEREQIHPKSDHSWISEESPRSHGASLDGLPTMRGSLIALASGNASAVQRFIAAFEPESEELRQVFRAGLAAIFDEAIGGHWCHQEAISVDLERSEQLRSAV